MQETVKKSRKRPADRVNRLVSERRKPKDDPIIDELLKDDSNDAASIEENALEKSRNNFVKFENVGFRTNGSFVVKDEIVTSSQNLFRPSFSVPPSLPSLQKKSQPKEVKYWINI